MVPKRLPKPVGKTYNFTVEVGHTFYMGERGTWVHNTGACDVPVGTKSPEAGTKPGEKFKNLFPNDPVVPGPRYERVKAEGGCNYRVAAGMCAPKGKYDFIQEDGGIYMVSQGVM